MPKPRKKDTKSPEKTMRIFCEGEKTEPSYIEGYIGQTRVDNLTTVVKVESTRKNTPVQLVEEAVKLKKSRVSLPDDEFWVVYDRESIAKYPDALHAKAADMAKANGIEIALTNVCFECWLHLHFEHTTAPYSCYDDFSRRSNFKTLFKEKSGMDYEKSSKFLFETIKSLIPQARQRANRINADSLRNCPPGKTAHHQINPYFGMPKLLDDIDNF
ncbi:RloB family protein [Ruegeria sp. SCP11]|uniref:RloB family protein n=1 Tax=Ruegeria sp. SCP11 TaxID=3141378 RepID=UPI00333DE2A8